MAKITATFLGTGTSQGIPVIACQCAVCTSSNPKDNRTRTSLLVSIGEHNLVIDTGPDFRQQMLREKVMRLDGIIYTHEHKDHIAGMDDIRAYNYASASAMEIYATVEVQAALQREFHYVFSGSNYPGIPVVKLNTISDEPFVLFDEKITPVEVMHYQLPVKAFRIRNFTYITDANFIDEANMEKIKGSEILVINALRTEPHISHFNLAGALEIIERVNPKQAYLVHISHLLGLTDEVQKLLPSNVSLAYDGLKIDVS